MKTTTDRVVVDRHQRGQVTPLVLVALLIATLLCVGLVRVGVAASQRAQAQAAADAVALAGASAGEPAARDVARSNDAEVVSFDDQHGVVEVVIERRGATATARARWDPAPIP